jgi:hypothetical protein
VFSLSDPLTRFAFKFGNNSLAFDERLAPKLDSWRTYWRNMSAVARHMDICIIMMLMFLGIRPPRYFLEEDVDFKFGGAKPEAWAAQA